ncbi:MAG: efflux RND transporter periplasmic adaptor subunit [Phycisphaerae bacterium]|nr:efflux RND transporter periplasmic adaptor subunit [Phycisphaerae bacterium]
MKLIGIILLVVLAAAGGAAGYALWLEYQTPEVEGAVTLYGNVEIREADLAFNGEEHIAEVLVEEGDRVEKGQILARLQTDRLEDEIARANSQIDAQSEVLRRLENGTRPQEIEQARARVASGEARVENAQRVVDRLRESAQSGASSQQDLDDALARLAVERSELNVRREELDLALEGPRKEDIAEARAHLAAAKADLSLLQDRLDDTTLRAPAVGVIQSRILEPGEFAAPSRPVFSLALIDPKWVRAYVPQPDLGKIQQGMKAHVMSDSFPDQMFEGWVGFISPKAEFTPKSVQTEDLRTRLVYEVRVYVNDTENRLRLGQPVTVHIERDSSTKDGG